MLVRGQLSVLSWLPSIAGPPNQVSLPCFSRWKLLAFRWGIGCPQTTQDTTGPDYSVFSTAVTVRCPSHCSPVGGGPCATCLVPLISVAGSCLRYNSVPWTEWHWSFLLMGTSFPSFYHHFISWMLPSGVQQKVRLLGSSSWGYFLRVVCFH